MGIRPSYETQYSYELGCTAGQVIRYLEKMRPTKWQVVSTDGNLYSVFIEWGKAMPPFEDDRDD